MDLPIAHIIDDDDGVRHALTEFLAVEGFAPRAYTSGWHFIRESPDISRGGVLLDIHAPGTLGAEMREYLQRHRTSRTVVIFMRSVDAPQTSSLALQVGATVLDKPFITSDLKKNLAHLLRSSS